MIDITFDEKSTERSEELTETSVHSNDQNMLEEINLLLIPTPSSWENEYRNKVVLEIYEELPVSSMVSLQPYVAFVKDQREDRLKIMKK